MTNAAPPKASMIMGSTSRSSFQKWSGKRAIEKGVAATKDRRAQSADVVLLGINCSFQRP
jgi:hypothetical protein